MTVQKPITTKDIADKVGLKPNTIRKWVNEFDIPHQKDHNKVRYSEDTVSMIEKIFELKEAGNSTKTIRRLINCDDGAHVNNDTHTYDHIDMEEPENNDSETVTPPSRIDREFVELVEVKMNQALSQINSLSMELAESKFKEGQAMAKIESLNEHRERDNREMVEKQSRYESELKEQSEELARLKEELETEKKKSWWAKLMGG